MNPLGKQQVPWQATGEVFEHFGRIKTEAQRNYRQFVADGLAMGKRDDLTGGGLRRSAGGWQGVHALERVKEYWRSDERVLGDGSFVESMLKISDEKMARKEKLRRQGWDMNKLTERASRLMGIKREEIFKRGKQNQISQARSLVAYWALRN